MADKIIKWFSTERGRKFTFGLVCATGVGIYSSCTVQHTFLLNKYKEIVHLYKSGISQKLTETQLDRFNKAADLLELTDIDRNRIKPFAVVGFDMFSAGTLFSKFGGIIGIPINFTYKDPDAIEKKDIVVLNEPVDWSMPESKQLLESLVLSENAQLFGIAREISLLNSMKLFLDTFYATSVFILSYGMGHNVNKRLGLFQRPLSLRVCLYSLITFFGFGIYTFFTDYTQNYFDKKVDSDLCEINPIFIQGGKEFYEKQIQRNIALRKLLGSFGERKYSVLGNENYLIRQKRLPLATRRDIFVNKLQEIM